jgi:hypothetical protein
MNGDEVEEDVGIELDGTAQVFHRLEALAAVRARLERLVDAQRGATRDEPSVGDGAAARA